MTKAKESLCYSATGDMSCCIVNSWGLFLSGGVERGDPTIRPIDH